MTKTNRQYGIEELKRAEQRRQAILDFLNMHGPSNFDALRAEFKHIKFDTLRGSVAGMLRMREIAATGPSRSHIYIALVVTTRSAEQIRATKTQKTRESNNRTEKRTNFAHDAKREAKRQEYLKREAELCAMQSNVAPGHYRHDPDKFRHYPSGGQGAVRRTVFVNCEQFY